MSSTTEPRKNDPEHVSSTEECEMTILSSNSPIVDLKDYDISEKTIQYIQVNHVIETPKMRNAEAIENVD